MRERDPVSSITSDASSRMVNSFGLPILIGPVTSSARIHQANEAVDQIIDITKRARLQSVAEHGDIAAEQGLHDEVRYHAAVVGVHARPVGVEDARDLDAQFVLAPIIEEQGFGAALAFIVAGARADRVDVAPIILGLRMHVGIAVDFGGRGLENFGAQALGQSQHVDGAVDAGLGGLHRIVLIMDRRGRTGQIVDLIHLDIERKRHVVAHQLEAVVIDHAIDVAACAGEKIIDADDVGAVLEQALAKMRAEKSGAAGHKHAGFEMHIPQPLERVRNQFAADRSDDAASPLRGRTYAVDLGR